MPPPSSRPRRIVMVGPRGVGKTAYIQHLLYGNHFLMTTTQPSVSDIYEVCVSAERGTTERLQVFDVPGNVFENETNVTDDPRQDHFCSIAEAYILMFNVGVQTSFDKAVMMRQKFISKTKEIPFVVIGMKSDISMENENKVNFQSVDALVKSHDSSYFECTVVKRSTLSAPLCYLANRLSCASRLGSSRFSIHSASSSGGRDSSPTPSDAILLPKQHSFLSKEAEPVTSCLPNGSLLSCLGIKQNTLS